MCVHVCVCDMKHGVYRMYSTMCLVHLYYTVIDECTNKISEVHTKSENHHISATYSQYYRLEFTNT